MDVNIDSRFVVAEREKRAWSQQHLAEAAGLALRTIQRIEARGTGSYESAKAIAACLGVQVVDLRTPEEPMKVSFIGSRAARAAGLCGAAAVAGVAALFFSNAFAQQVLLDVGVTEEEFLGETAESGVDVRSFKSTLLLDHGEEKDVPLEDEFNLVISPSILDDGKVLLAVKFYEHRDHGFELVDQPRVITPSGEVIELQFVVSENPQRTYRVAIKPQIQ